MEFNYSLSGNDYVIKCIFFKSIDNFCLHRLGSFSSIFLLYFFPNYYYARQFFL